MPDQKQDMFDRKMGFIERMFDKITTAISNDVKGTILAISVMVNVWLMREISDVNRLRIEDITSLNEKINIAVEKRVSNEIPKQLAPYKEQQDSNSKKLDTSLINLNGTVEKVQKYIDKQRK